MAFAAPHFVGFCGSFLTHGYARESPASLCPLLCPDSVPVCAIQDHVDNLSNVEEAAIVGRR